MATSDTPGTNLEQEFEQLQREERELEERTTSFQGFLIAGSVAAFVALVTAVGALVVALTNTGSEKTTVITTSAPSAATAQPAVPAGLPSKLAVGLKEFKVLPSSTQAKAGRVTFNVRNNGTTTHEFVVLKTNTPSGSLPLDKGRASEAGNIGETGDLQAGTGKSLTLNLKPGHYALICNLPGHYVAGQHADLIVK